MQKESAYLDSTPNGNIITGFDNYMKGTSGAAAQRRKTGPAEQNRVFSRSSISYRPNNGVSLFPKQTKVSGLVRGLLSTISARFANRVCVCCRTLRLRDQ